MATHDYVIANGSGAAVRSDLNGALAAIASNNSSATEPSPAYAYMWWSDTTTGLLKIRNAANTAWVTVGTLASTNLGLLASAGTLAAALGSASTPGITFTGDLNTGIYSPGADQVAISTNGTGRLFVDASGSVGLGTSQNPTTGGFARPVFFLKQFSDPSSGFAGIHIEASGDESVLGIGYNGTTNAFEFNTSFRGTGARRAIVFKTTGAECARIDSTGELLVGKTTVTANGGVLQVSNGITFPATQVACTDANTLDDYEEGTWTPSIGGTATYSKQDGSYTKIGRVVTVRFDMAITTIGTGSTQLISGLPFSVGSAASSEGYGATGYFANLAINVIGLTCYAVASSSTIGFNSIATAGVTATNNPAIFGNSARVQGSVTYFV